MYRIIILASALVLFGCGHKGNQSNNTNVGMQSEDNKAITVKKPSSSGDHGLQELKEEKHGLNWQQENSK